MPQSSDETLFLAFQQHRDVAALSTLFSRHADELLRLAVFLSPRPTDAEDLLQATFLSAIARAETYRKGFRVMSWLCGILTNHARMLRRAERRQMPETAAVDGDHDPVDAALRSELRQALKRSITQLGEPYRSVLTLHLHDGLNSQEISQRLDRPPATVRKQMGRALQQLRQALPLGLATALVMKMSPAQIAVNAAEAAQYVDASTQVGDAVASNTVTSNTVTSNIASSNAASSEAVESADFDDGIWLDPIASPARLLSLIGGLVAAAMLVAFVVPGWFGSAAIDDPNPVENVIAEVSPPPAKVLADSAAVQPARVVAPPTANSHTLLVKASAPDGVPRAGVEVLCIPDDGRGLTTRLMSDTVRQAATDAAGVVAFADLPPGKYDLTISGSIPKTAVRLVDRDVEHEMTLPIRRTYSGTVTDAGGRPVAGATVLVGETGGRGELVTPIAVTDATGFFEGACLMASGQILARHPDYSQSRSSRILVDRPVYLKLEPLDEQVQVCVTDPDGNAVANCLVGLVPKSQDMKLLPPHQRLTGEDGCCTLPGPGLRQATIVAQHAKWASTHIEFERGAGPVAIALASPAHVAGVLLDSAGQSMANKEVALLVTATNTNDSVGTMLQMRCRSDEEGRFAFDRAPRSLLQVRVSSGKNGVVGPPMFQFVVAGTTVDTREGGDHVVNLVARKMKNITGVLRRPSGLPIVGFHVLAVPNQGTAGHRMFRRRAARTDEEGRFVLQDVSSTEKYRLGVFPPSRWWPNPTTWPIAMIESDCNAPVDAVLDTSRELAGTLACQVLRPDGKPARGASLELRHLDYHSPFVTTTDTSGNGSFSGLPGGDYWLAVKAAGLGAATQKITIEGDQHQLDLGTVQLQEAARIYVRITGRSRVKDPVVHVIGRNSLGDKFVSANSVEWVARLKPLPPGKSTILLHGPGIAPMIVAKQFTPGRQWLDVEVEPANSVKLVFPFELSANPFVINGPLHVRVFDQQEVLVLEHYVGVAAEIGRFHLATGLRPGRYRVVARSLWNQLADGEIEVPTSGKPIEAEIPLKFERNN